MLKWRKKQANRVLFSCIYLLRNHLSTNVRRQMLASTAYARKVAASSFTCAGASRRLRSVPMPERLSGSTRSIRRPGSCGKSAFFTQAQRELHRERPWFGKRVPASAHSLAEGLMLKSPSSGSPPTTCSICAQVSPSTGSSFGHTGRTCWMNGGSATGAPVGGRLRASLFNVRRLGAFAQRFGSKS